MGGLPPGRLPSGVPGLGREGVAGGASVAGARIAGTVGAVIREAARFLRMAKNATARQSSITTPMPIHIHGERLFFVGFSVVTALMTGVMSLLLFEPFLSFR